MSSPKDVPPTADYGDNVDPTVADERLGSPSGPSGTTGPTETTGGTYVGPASNPEAYQLLSLVGAGGEAHVWRAVTRPDPSSPAGIAVAIKVFSIDLDADAERDWLRRTQAMRHLHNPGMARMHEAFVGAPMHPAGWPPDPTGPRCRYLVMELVDGPSLQEWVEDNPEASMRERLRMLSTLAAGLDALHTGSSTVPSVAHGDVKPDNARLTSDGGIKLVDFGLIRMRGTSRLGPAMASLAYTAPELFVAGEHGMPTPETDRFSFAATVFHVLTGVTPPLRADRRGPDPATMQPILERSPVTAGRPEVVATVMAGLAVDPAQRPTRLVTWLAAARRTETATIDPPDLTGISPTMPWPAQPRMTLLRRRPRRAVLVVVIAVLVVLVASLLGTFRGRFDSPGTGGATPSASSGRSTGSAAQSTTAKKPAASTGSGSGATGKLPTKPVTRETAPAPAGAKVKFQRRNLKNGEGLNMSTGVIGFDVPDKDIEYFGGTQFVFGITVRRTAISPEVLDRKGCAAALKLRSDGDVVDWADHAQGMAVCVTTNRGIAEVRLVGSTEENIATLEYVLF